METSVNNKCKAFTSLEQSKKLAEILPLESADMFYNEEPEDETYSKDIVDTEYPMVIREVHKHLLEEYGIPCWSLAALLKVIGHYTLQTVSDSKRVIIVSENGNPISSFSNPQPVDACVEMILKLHELKML